MKKNFFSFVILFFLIILFFSVSVIFVKTQIESVSNSSENFTEIEFEVKDGMNAKSVGNLLKSKNLIKNEKIFYAFARFPRIASIFTNQNESIFKIKKGDYLLNSSMNLVEIFAEISSGKERFVKVSIPEGLTLSKIALRFEKAGFSTAKEFEKVSTTQGKEIFSELGLNIQKDSVEGFLFPDTYNVPISFDAKKIILMMIKNLIKNVQSDDDTKDFFNNSSDEIYNTIILASIVEREYRVKDEASKIAGVFENRLKINMALQSCATVEYIITEIQHKPHPKIITYDDLEIKSSFNTYKNPGLPPSPISNPGFTAIKAAINPEKNNFLYFTLTDQENGSHTFSTNLSAHNIATNNFRTKRVNR